MIRHPGTVLWEEFMGPLKLSRARVARHLRVSKQTVCDLVSGKRRLTADMAVKLAAYFGNRAEWWLEHQLEWDLAKAREEVDVSGVPNAWHHCTMSADYFSGKSSFDSVPAQDSQPDKG